MDRPVKWKMQAGNGGISGTHPEEPFVQCPDVFLQELTPDQFRARQQLYQTAYEKAVAKAAQPKPFVPPFEFEFRDGI